MNDTILKTIGRYGLAPMAGYTDSSFRAICRGFGATFTITEMVSAKAIRFKDKKTPLLMRFTEEERPIGIQLFGSEPDDFRYAASFAEENFHPDFIDINMGCPAPKITGGGAGSKLMEDPSLASEIVRATVETVSLPVTVKMRAGYHKINAPEFAQYLEQAGVSAVFVHARTRDQMYHPPIFPEVIKDVKDKVSVPVYGNGDILTREDADRMQDLTGCDGVLIGRGALGNPFLFSALTSEESPVSLEDRIAVLLRHARASVEEKGEYVGIREMRKHAPYYFKGVNNAAAIRNECVSLSSFSELEALCRSVLDYGYAR
ncbi:MAG: tRNA dihydrouridine synthase DusB [Oscillospiraceae bacterium]|nr:tRNA dihydrouridine synthase DusB [Oscillospiraceae bacterium]